MPRRFVKLAAAAAPREVAELIRQGYVVSEEVAWARMVNGTFPVCPRCSQVMAKRHAMGGPAWSCLSARGCGFELRLTRPLGTATGD